MLLGSPVSVSCSSSPKDIFLFFFLRESRKEGRGERHRVVDSRWHPDQRLGIKPATRVTGNPTVTTEQHRPGPVSGSFPLPQATGPVHAGCIFKAPLSHICVSTGARGYLRHAREWGRLLCKCTFFPFLPPRVPRLRGVPPPPLSITWIPINMYVLYVHLCCCK